MPDPHQHPSPRPGPILRRPRPEDGSTVWDLVAASGGLDQNSLYCNLLQCSFFSESCLLAEEGGRAVGWVSALIPPTRPDTLFVWQICTLPEMRGTGLASALLQELVARARPRPARLSCTITDGNVASQALFARLARLFGVPLDKAPFLDTEAHFRGRQAGESLYEIAVPPLPDH